MMSAQRFNVYGANSGQFFFLADGGLEPTWRWRKCPFDCSPRTSIIHYMMLGVLHSSHLHICSHTHTYIYIQTRIYMYIYIYIYKYR